MTQSVSTMRAVSIIVLLSMLLSGCFSSRNSGGYYKDDGPPRRNVNVAKIADAVPRQEPLSRTGNKPYKALGKRYYPMDSAKGYKERGQASWYGKKFHGNRTSSGEPYDMYAMTAAHKTLPLPTYVRVVNVDNNRAVVVKVNDRGPFLHNRIIDLSYVAAKKLDMLGRGTANVFVEAIDPKTYRASKPAANVATVPATRSGVPVVQAGVGVASVALPSQPVARTAIQRQPIASSQAVARHVPQSVAVPNNAAQSTPLPTQQVSRSVNQYAAPNAVPVPSNNTPVAASIRLQVGAFTLATNAANMQTRLIEDGFAAVAVIKSAGLYKVILGPYKPADADSERLRLQQLGYTVKLYRD